MIGFIVCVVALAISALRLPLNVAEGKLVGAFGNVLCTVALVYYVTKSWPAIYAFYLGRKADKGEIAMHAHAVGNTLIEWEGGSAENPLAVWVNRFAKQWLDIETAIGSQEPIKVQIFVRPMRNKKALGWCMAPAVYGRKDKTFIILLAETDDLARLESVFFHETGHFTDDLIHLLAGEKHGSILWADGLKARMADEMEKIDKKFGAVAARECFAETWAYMLSSTEAQRWQKDNAMYQSWRYVTMLLRLKKAIPAAIKAATQTQGHTKAKAQAFAKRLNEKLKD